MRSLFSGSRDAVGSSAKRILGRSITARAKLALTSSKIYLTANIAYTSIYSCPKRNCQRALGLMKYQTIGQVMWIIVSHDRWLIAHWHGHRLHLNPVLPSALPRD